MSALDPTEEPSDPEQWDDHECDDPAPDEAEKMVDRIWEKVLKAINK